MKKSIYWQIRKYVGNYLLNLMTHGEIFYVINISWFSMNIYHKFCSYNIAVHFLQRVFIKVLNVLFCICQIKISDYPGHSLSIYDIFNGKK